MNVNSLYDLNLNPSRFPELNLLSSAVHFLTVPTMAPLCVCMESAPSIGGEKPLARNPFPSSPVKGNIQTEHLKYPGLFFQVQSACTSQTAKNCPTRKYRMRLNSRVNEAQKRHTISHGFETGDTISTLEATACTCFKPQTPQNTSMSNLFQANTKVFFHISIDTHANSTTAPFFKHHVNKLENSSFHMHLIRKNPP